jgi:hypothetical protein
MADIGAVPAVRTVEEGGDQLVPLNAPVIRMADIALDLSSARVVGLPNSVRTMTRNDVEGILPASVRRRDAVPKGDRVSD